MLWKNTLFDVMMNDVIKAGECLLWMVREEVCCCMLHLAKLRNTHGCTDKLTKKSPVQDSVVVLFFFPFYWVLCCFAKIFFSPPSLSRIEMKTNFLKNN